jgi:hypothetical protein
MPPTPEVEAAKAAAEAVNGGPFSLQSLVPTFWMVGIAVAGGAVSFYRKMKEGKVRAFNVTEFVGEIFTSAFVGLVTFWICKAYGVGEYLTAAAVAITGHMGARAIFMAEQKIEEWTKK